jgi:hypothetical protein
MLLELDDVIIDQLMTLLDFLNFESHHHDMIQITERPSHAFFENPPIGDVIRVGNCFKHPFCPGKGSTLAYVRKCKSHALLGH